MTQGRSIRLFLVDGIPSGLLTAEIVNWTGHVLTGPRSKLSELVQRPECARTGVYFLVGPPPEDSLHPLVYIGETDDVGKRLKQHNRPEGQGGKDFWEKVFVVTSKDQNLTKAHAKYLESLLIQNATTVGRCTLVNGTAHEYASLPESDRADMAFFIEQIRTVLPVLGYDFLRQTARPSSSAETAATSNQTASPRFVLAIRRHGIQAIAQEIDGEFYVLKGSQARGSWIAAGHHYERLYNQLRNDGILVARDDGTLVFSDDQSFSSPSAAAAVISGRAANGRTAWTTTASGGQSYGEWQDQQVSAIESVSEADAP